MFRRRILSVAFAITFLLLIFPSFISAKVLFRDDFEADTVGKPPANWEHLGPPIGYTGGGLSVVEEDPLDSSNKVFHLIPVAFDTNSHDIWAVSAGDESWVDYVWEFDWLFPEDTYCPMAFRILSKDEFCQISRRPGGQEVHIYTYDAQQVWNIITSYAFPNEASKWYRVRISIEGVDIVFKIKERDDQTPFEEMDEPDVLQEQPTEPFPYGGIGAQEGYTGMIDNVIVGETAADILAVEPAGKAATCWGMLKNMH